MGPEVGTNRPEVARNGPGMGQKWSKMTENDLRHSNESRCNATFLLHFLRLDVAGYGAKMDCKYTKYRPKDSHPIFFGCFDWHSSAHGHWLLATVARRFSNTELSRNVTEVFQEQFQVK